MSDRVSFKEKLDEILKIAGEKGGCISLEEVKHYFAEENLSEEQMRMVCDFLLSRKMKVSGLEASGYISADNYLPEDNQDAEDQEKDAFISDPLSKEEQAYVEEYLRTLEEMQGGTPEELRLAWYLPKVVETAVELHRTEVFVGDMIQEANISLMLALQEIPAQEGEERQVLQRVREEVLQMLEEQKETKSRDEQMVEKVAVLDQTIREMKEEYGRKVSVEEVAGRLGVSEEEIEDILKLAGEEMKEEA